MLIISKTNRIKNYCPNCKSEDIIKRGIRKNKKTEVQIYFCRSCNKKFTKRNNLNKTYTMREIINSLTYYNMGYTFDEINKKIKIPRVTVFNWVKEYESLFDLRFNHKEIKIFSEKKEPITSFRYQHSQLFEFQVHNFKNEKVVYPVYPELYKYLDNLSKEILCNNIYKSSTARASQCKLNIMDKIPIRQISGNNTTKFSKLLPDICYNNKDRHNKLEKLLLYNDNSTIAVEVPVYLNLINYPIEWVRKITSENDYIAGHIDFIQVRNNNVYILDYKPNADKENPLGQLFIYACALSKITGINFFHIILGWFDENNYYECYTMDVYKEVMKMK